MYSCISCVRERRSGLWGFEVEGNKVIAFMGRDLAAAKCPEL